VSGSAGGTFRQRQYPGGGFAVLKIGKRRACARPGRWRRGLCDAVFSCGSELTRAGDVAFYNYINSIGCQ
jgi:hypothetical protein